MKRIQTNSCQLLVTLCLAVSAFGQDVTNPVAPVVDLPLAEGSGSVDPELERMEENYLTELTEARAELGAKYLSALERLQESLTKAGEFDQALLVKEEIERIEEMLSHRMESTRPLPSGPSYDPVVLWPADALLKGKISLSKADILYKWRRGASAEWELPGDLPEGTYEIIMTRSCREEEGGRYTVQAGDKVLSGSIVGEGEWTDWSQVHVGDLEIDDGIGMTLRITADRTANDFLMNVRRVIVAEKGTWERIQAGEEIGAIADSSSPNGGTASGGKLRLLELATLLEGEDTPLDGDSFHVTSGGDSYHLRLFWVDAPIHSGDPDSPEMKSAVEEEAAYFGITPEDSIRVGKAAADYVRTLLTGKQFSVLVSRQTSYSGAGQARKMAMLKVGNKYLSQLLIENGLARIRGAQVDIPDGLSAPEYLETLKAAEAKAREQRKGAWGM